MPYEPKPISAIIETALAGNPATGLLLGQSAEWFPAIERIEIAAESHRTVAICISHQIVSDGVVHPNLRAAYIAHISVQSALRDVIELLKSDRAEHV